MADAFHPHPFRDYRAEGLLCAARTCAGVVKDLLARHPDSAALRAQSDAGEGPPLRALLWQELLDAERGAGRRPDPPADSDRHSGPEYWQRRRRLAELRRRQEAASRLPAHWVKLLEMPANSVRSVCTGIGIEMIAHATAGQSPQQAARWLGPLGPELTSQVTGRPRYLRAGVVTGTAPRWREAYGRLVRQVTGPKIASAMGRSLLAAQFRRLPSQDRRDAARASRSSLPELLEEDLFLEPVTPEELALGAALLAELTARVEVAPGSVRQ